MKRHVPLRRTPLSRVPQDPGQRYSSLARSKGLGRSRNIRGGLKSGIPEGVRREVYGRSGGICERCRKRRATVLHHRLPQSAGGPDTPDNMVDLCEPCHTGPDGVHRNPARSYEEGWLISRYAQGNRSPD